MNRIQLTPDNSNLPPTRSNFCFPSDHFCIIFPRELGLRFKRVKSWEKKINGVLKSKTLNSIENNRVIFLSAFIFCHPNSVSIPLCHIKRCCLIPCSQYQSLFLAAFEVKYARYLHSFPIHLLISSYLFRTHDNSNFFSVSIKGSSYRESTLVSNDENPLLAPTPRGIKRKKFIFNPWINLHVISAYWTIKAEHTHIHLISTRIIRVALLS